MLTEKELTELHNAPDESLAAIMRIMGYQIDAKLFIGDRARSQAIYDASAEILKQRFVERANG